MKREAIQHFKMKRLCRALNIPLFYAVGILETVWHITATQTPRGNIGKLSNEDLAVAIDFENIDQLVVALVATGWLDPHPEYRLIIHDWHDHADQAVHKKVARAKQFFITRNGPLPPNWRLLPKRDQEKEGIRAFYESVTEHQRTSAGHPQDILLFEEPTTYKKNGHPADIRRTSGGHQPEPEPEPDKTRKEDLVLTAAASRPVERRRRRKKQSLEEQAVGTALNATLKKFALPAFDEGAVHRLVDALTGIEPNTIVQMCNAKLAQNRDAILSGKIQNVIGFLLSTVPKMQVN